MILASANSSHSQGPSTEQFSARPRATSTVFILYWKLQSSFFKVRISNFENYILSIYVASFWTVLEHPYVAIMISIFCVENLREDSRILLRFSLNKTFLRRFLHRKFYLTLVTRWIGFIFILNPHVSECYNTTLCQRGLL